MPLHFPSDLKGLVLKSWSIEPKERPQIPEFKSALNTMLTGRMSQDLTPPNLSLHSILLASPVLLASSALAVEAVSRVSGVPRDEAFSRVLRAPGVSFLAKRIFKKEQ